MPKVKKALFWISFVLILFIAQGIALSFIYEKEIKQLALKELNKHLDSPVQVQEIQLTFWRHFPYISLSFQEVHIKGSNPKINSSLLKAEEISMLFNFWDLYRGSYKVQKLVVNSAIIHTAIDQWGVPNYDIIKENGGESSELLIDLKHVQFTNSHYTYEDQNVNDRFQFFIQNLKCSGIIETEKVELQVTTDGYCQLIQVDGKKILAQKRINVSGPIFINIQNEQYKFQKVMANVEGIGMEVNGLIDVDAGSINYQLSAIAKGVDLNKSKNLIPAKYYRYINDYKATGTFDASIIIQGPGSATTTPLVEANAKIREGSLQLHKKNGIGNLERISSELFYSNQATKSLVDDILELSKFQCFIQGKELTGSLSIKDFDRFLLDFSLKTKQTARDIYLLFPIEAFSVDQGNLDISLQVKGYYNDLINPNASETIFSRGEIRLQNIHASFKNSELSITDLNADLVFGEHDLKIVQSRFNLGKSDFAVTGYIRNFLGYLLSDKKEIALQAKLFSKEIDLYDLLSSNTNADAENPKQIALPAWLKADLIVDVKQLNFEKFKAFDIQGRIYANNLKINSDYLAFRAQGGLVFSNFEFNMANPNSMPLKLNFILNKIDIHQMFEEFNNFGLEIITSQNIFGQVSSSMQAELYLNKNLESDLDKFYAKGDVVIENGKLLKFDPLLSLGKYIDINELVDLRFSKLQNTIEIKNQTLHIPTMHVSSNAIDLDISGIHRFDNSIDYNIKVLLADILWKKSKKNNQSEFGEIESESDGRASLYIRMYGDAENPKFSLDKRSIKKKMKEDLQKEKKVVKDVLKSEVDGWFKKDQEYKSEQEQELQDWEKDFPTNSPNSKAPATNTDTTKSKNKFQKLKKKLQEPVIDDDL